MEIPKKWQFLFLFISFSFYISMYIHVKSIADKDRIKKVGIHETHEKHREPEIQLPLPQQTGNNINWVETNFREDLKKVILVSRNSDLISYFKNINIENVSLIHQDVFSEKNGYKYIGLFKHPISALQDLHEKLANIGHCVSYYQGSDSLVKQLCGNTKICEKTNRESFEQARRNIKKHFILISMIDNYSSFKVMAIKLFPFIFRDIPNITVIKRKGNIYSCKRR